MGLRERNNTKYQQRKYVVLAIENKSAFKNALWEEILKVLKTLRIALYPQKIIVNYLKDRNIEICENSIKKIQI